MLFLHHYGGVIHKLFATYRSFSAWWAGLWLNGPRSQGQADVSGADLEDTPHWVHSPHQRKMCSRIVRLSLFSSSLSSPFVAARHQFWKLSWKSATHITTTGLSHWVCCFWHKDAPPECWLCAEQQLCRTCNRLERCHSRKEILIYEEKKLKWRALASSIPGGSERPWSSLQTNWLFNVGWVTWYHTHVKPANIRSSRSDKENTGYHDYEIRL